MIGLCSTLGKSPDELVPCYIDDLRFYHIESLMEIVDNESNDYKALQSMLKPRDRLNNTGLLSKRIWRYVDFKRKDEDECESISRALVLREGTDVLFDVDTEMAIAQPKLVPGAFKGLSCYLECPCAQHVLLDRMDTFPTSSELRERERLTKNNFSVSKVRSVIAVYLDQGASVSVTDWIIDANDLEPGHVTVAVNNPNGLAAFQPPMSTHKVCIQALTNLPWCRLKDTVLILKADAEWRDDYFPGNDAWRNIVNVLDTILIDGSIDAFFAVWFIHSIVHQDKVGLSVQDIQRDMLHVLRLIQKVLSEFEYSDEFDINSPSPTLYRAINDVEYLISQV